ncbi:MAG: site-specific DNA-methyltransferase [Sphingobacteriales bacterium]|nr:MAG: site-specific DNA-methyltransferase [Sphingobacteriales bacterium]
MDGTSLTPQQEKLKALQELLPEAFGEGKIDWEKLKATLGEDINFSNERYVLNWAGKSDAFKVLQTPTTKTLIPCPEESVKADGTKYQIDETFITERQGNQENQINHGSDNIFIEGENLEVLKVLQKSYFGKVKMIYIDPPYNTGNDSFIYPDKFSETLKEYQVRVGDKDDEGYVTKDGMFKKNSKENGQYHSNWLNMMMPRLYLAKNLLRQDGVIFVSIDDNEVHNLRLLMNEIFGEENFVAQFIWKKKQGGGNDSNNVVAEHEYILSFTKSIDFLNLNLDKNYKLDDALYPFNDELGEYGLITLDKSSIRFSESLVFEIKDNEGNSYKPRIVNGKQSCWRWGKKKVTADFDKLVFKNGKIYTKYYRPDGITPKSLLIDSIYGRTETGNDDIKKLFTEFNPFSYPKPINLIKHFATIGTNSNDIILDFFAGSGTTAHAVMELNAADGGNRKYICVQMPELCDEKSEAYKAGYKTIADISKERIRRAGKKIQTQIALEIEKQKGQLNFENQENQTNQKNHSLDNGFKVLKLAHSNFKQWQQFPSFGGVPNGRGGTENQTQALTEQMQLFIDPVAENATIENMVYEFLLKSGKDLNSKIEQKFPSNGGVAESRGGYFVINNSEIIMLLEKVSQTIIEQVIAHKPMKVIALDKLFTGNDQLKTNTVLQMRDAGIEFKTI